MPAKLPDETIQKIVSLRRDGLSLREIGKSLGIDHTTAGHYVRTYCPESVKGEPPNPSKLNKVVDRTDVDGSVEVLKQGKPFSDKELMHLCGLDPAIWIPQFYRGNIWEGFYKLPDGEGHRTVPLSQSRIVCRRILTEDLEQAILEFVRTHVGPLPKPELPRRRRREGQALSLGVFDAHIGMFSWRGETGDDYDTKIAVSRICSAIDDLVEDLAPYPIEKVWMPIGQDFLHFDNVRHTTSIGEVVMDTDSRFPKVYMAGLTCLVYIVERALELCDDVELIYSPGNHDYLTSFTLCVALEQRYRNDHRVRVDLSANPRKWRTHGGTLLGFAHGKDARAPQLAQIFSVEAKEVWSNTTYREIQIGHTHKKKEENFGGISPTPAVTVVTNPSLASADFYHHSKGFIDGPLKSIECRRFDRVGFRGSHAAWSRSKEK